jgi:hypothetical protein
MQTIIWAFGSSLVLMLIISFLPLGFTLKGKLFVVLAGFVLALGGLAATTSFPIGAIVLMLLVLAFFVAYMIDSRMGSLVYAEQDKAGEVVYEDTEQPLGTKQSENHELEDMEFQLEKSEVSFNFVATPSSKEEKNDFDLDEDIAFLQERETKVEFEPVIVDPQVEVSYLSDIESMLLEESVKSLETEKDWLDKVTVTKEKVEVENNQLVESELELLFGLNEAAAGHDENLPVSKSMPVVDIKK